MVLIGLGNPLMSDEGIGVRLVAEVETRGTAPPDVEIMDLGTAGVGILHAISGRRKAVFVDCALMGETPGTIRRFTTEDVVSRNPHGAFSLHEADLLQTLGLARRLGDCPEAIVIFGVEPVSIAPGRELSVQLESRLGEYLDVVGAELNRGV